MGQTLGFSKELPVTATYSLKVTLASTQIINVNNPSKIDFCLFVCSFFCTMICLGNVVLVSFSHTNKNSGKLAWTKEDIAPSYKMICSVSTKLAAWPSESMPADVSENTHCLGECGRELIFIHCNPIIISLSTYLEEEEPFIQIGIGTSLTLYGNKS